MNPITNLAPASNYIDDYARSSRRNRITDRRSYWNTNFFIAILLFRAILTDIPGIQLALSPRSTIETSRNLEMLRRIGFESFRYLREIISSGSPAASQENGIKLNFASPFGHTWLLPGLKSSPSL